MDAERRLQEAEKSLHRLGHAVENETPNIETEVKQQMVVNVNKLKGIHTLLHSLLSVKFQAFKPKFRGLGYISLVFSFVV